MERYSEYKDSGVQWLGEIPGHWGGVPLKRICEMKSGNNLTSLDILDKGEFPVYGANGFRGYYNQYNKEGKYILIGRQGALAGNVHLVDGKFWATDHAVVTNITSDKVFVDYISLALISMNLNQYAFDTAAQPGLAVSKIISFSTPLPPLSEQHSIVSYLDDKCGKIDKMLEGKQKQIELLAEMKQRIIADAVTRGLNPDAKMKATNIPWLPEIPEHWAVKPIRAILRENNEKTETGDEELLSLSQYTGISLKRDAGKTGMFEAESTIGYKKVHPGQFVMNIMLAWNGSYAVSGLEGIISPAYCVFDFISNDNKMYYNYLWRLGVYQGAFKTESRGIIDSRLRLYPNKFLPFPTICPPLEEQDSIVNYINEKVVKIDTLTSKLQQEIESIKEYKQRLISDVVTGQIKVC